jgi:hypothetical protein
MGSKDIKINIGLDQPVNVNVGLEQPIKIKFKETIQVVNQTSANYIHVQSLSSSVWTINHTLQKFASVTIVDSAENVVYGDIQYISASQIIVTFSAAFGGKAYLN